MEGLAEAKARGDLKAQANFASKLYGQPDRIEAASILAGSVPKTVGFTYVDPNPPPTEDEE